MGNHKIKLLRTLIQTLEENSGIQKPGFGREKEFTLILANNKYKMPEKVQQSPSLEQESPLTKQKEKINDNELQRGLGI